MVASILQCRLRDSKAAHSAKRTLAEPPRQFTTSRTSRSIVSRRRSPGHHRREITLGFLCSTVFCATLGQERIQETGDSKRRAGWILRVGVVSRTGSEVPR